MSSRNSPFGYANALQGEVTVCDAGGETGTNKIVVDDVGDFEIQFPEGFVDLDDGNVTRFASVEDIFTRGRFRVSRMGQQQPITGKFTAPLRGMTGGVDSTAATLLDLGTWNPNRSPAHWVDGWLPSHGTASTIERFEGKLVYRVKGLTHGDTKDHKLKLSRVQFKIPSIAEAIQTDIVSVEWRAWELEAVE